MAEKIVNDIVDAIGLPKDQLNQGWVRKLALLNGCTFLVTLYPQIMEKFDKRSLMPNEDAKVASFKVMNFKYVGLQKLVLFTHIASGLVSVLGSTAALYTEETDPEKAKRWAYISSLSETFFHGPSALLLTPHVYGDKGVTPVLYLITSSLLVLSGASAFFESQNSSGKDFKLPELRRMNSTLHIFLYVRLYGFMRGIDGFLEPQKYTSAIATSGLAMMAVGWKSFLFPLTFWTMMVYNYKTLLQTYRLIDKHGIDKGAMIQGMENFPKLKSTKRS